MRPSESNFVRIVDMRRNQIEAIRNKYWLSPEQAPEEEEEENDLEYEDEPEDTGN